MNIYNYQNLQNSSYLFKIIWGKRYIGIAIDRILNKDKNQTSPLTTFFFWPRENGWELLKNQLINKPWITKDERIEILNGYNKLINYWLTNVKQVNEINKIIQDSSTLKFELSCIIL